MLSLTYVCPKEKVYKTVILQEIEFDLAYQHKRRTRILPDAKRSYRQILKSLTPSKIESIIMQELL